MNNIDTIIWDWNGTLFNDVDICIESINQLLSDRKLPALSKKDYREAFDFPVQKYYERIGFDFNKEPFEIPAKQFIDIYFQHIGKAGLYKSVRETLKYFAGKGYKQLILSAAEQQKLRNLVSHFGIDNFFLSVQGLNNDFATSKIDLGINQLKRLEIVPAHACLIGDTTHDFEVASAMGCPSVLVANGHHPIEKLEKTGTKVVKDITKLPMLF